MPLDLEIFCDTIDMWSFHFRCWSTIALVTLCIASLCKMTSPWGFKFFFLDIINIYLSLVYIEGQFVRIKPSATLANSELRI